MKHPNDFKQYDDVRSTCGKARIQYIPYRMVDGKVYVNGNAWRTFIRGDAGQEFATLDDAVNYMKRRAYYFE